MFIEDQEREVREIEARFEWELAEMLRRFPHHHYRREHRPGPIQVLFTRLNNQNFIIMSPLSLNNGNSAPIQAALVDAATLQPIPGATKVPKSASSDTPTAATVDSNGNLVAVAVGTGNLTVVNTWTYTDQNTGQPVTADETTVIAFQVVATPEGVLQVVTLGAQVPSAPAA